MSTQFMRHGVRIPFLADLYHSSKITKKLHALIGLVRALAVSYRHNRFTFFIIFSVRDIRPYDVQNRTSTGTLPT